MSERVWTPDDWTVVGSVFLDDGELAVWRRRDGLVSLDVPVNPDGCVFLGDVERDKLRELLDRAAMPGQPAGAEADRG